MVPQISKWYFFPENTEIKGFEGETETWNDIYFQLATVNDAY